MKAFVTSIGEKTTELCIWALERNGFDVELVQAQGTLAGKLEYIYSNTDNDFVRVDADVIVNRTLQEDRIKSDLALYPEAWWLQYQTYGWFQQNLIYGGVQIIKKEILPILRLRIREVARIDRPETALSRMPELYNPRRFDSHNACVGIHGFGQSPQDIERVVRQKKQRNYFNDYDFELAEKLAAL